MKEGLLNELGEQVEDKEAGGRGRQASWSEWLQAEGNRFRLWSKATSKWELGYKIYWSQARVNTTVVRSGTDSRESKGLWTGVDWRWRPGEHDFRLGPGVKWDRQGEWQAQEEENTADCCDQHFACFVSRSDIRNSLTSYLVCSANLTYFCKLTFYFYPYFLLVLQPALPCRKQKQHHIFEVIHLDRATRTCLIIYQFVFML